MFAIWPLCSLISSRHSWVTDIARSYRQIRFFLLFHLDVFLEPFSEPFFARLSWQNERTFNRRLDGRKLSKVWSSLTSRVTSGSESLNVLQNFVACSPKLERPFEYWGRPQSSHDRRFIGAWWQGKFRNFHKFRPGRENLLLLFRFMHL